MLICTDKDGLLGGAVRAACEGYVSGRLTQRGAEQRIINQGYTSAEAERILYRAYLKATKVVA